MKRYYFTLILVVFIGFSSSCQKKFNQKIWLENNDTKDTKNPRVHMTKDLMDNYLIVGMDKKEVVKLLGTPFSDKVEKYIPKNLNPPDSLQPVAIFDKPKEQREKYLSLLKQWREKNYKSAPMLVYYAGWSLMDPVFLEIIFNEKNEVVDFWVKQS